MSTSSKPQLTAEQIQKTRARFKRFRILVIGRANAGKTTILRRLCNTTGDPIILSPDGEKIESSVLNPSLNRGQHDIENQMVFEGNTGFVFHDSRGFEAGGVDELKLVQQFIEERSKARNVNEQLHAIWYCIPTSDDRPITKAERIFFNECGTGLVPVIVLWTKTDSLDVAVIKQLIEKEGKSYAKAKEQAPKKAWADFEKNNHQPFDKFKYPPKAYVMLRKMHEPEASCNDLIVKTTAALSSEDLQQLFLSTQENNLKACVKYGIERVVNPRKDMVQYFKKENWACVMLTVLRYFPHFCILDFDDKLHDQKHQVLKDVVRRAADRRRDLLDDLLDVQFDRDLLDDDAQDQLDDDLDNDNHKLLDSISRIMSFTLLGLSASYNPKDATYSAIVAAILGYLLYFLYKQSSFTKNSFERAAQIYQESNCDTSIKQAVENLFKHSHINYQSLAEGAIQIALDNLLSVK